MGVFASAQPEYAAYGIPTFPVHADKRPAAKGYNRIGLKGSRALADKMPNAPCVGFLAGPRSNISVLDVDTPCERTFADALDRHGQTPVIIRTGSGNWQAWYRNNGEGRSIRPDASLPIDVLGEGVVIAPPSEAAKGLYRFLQGSLADLAALPLIKGLAAIPARSRTLREGEGRNNALWRHCMAQAPSCDTQDDLIDVARTYAEQWFADRMPDTEIIRTAASAWGYQERGENYFGQKRRIADMTGLAGLARDNPDALALIVILRERHAQDAEFPMANAMAKEMNSTLPRWRTARDKLIQEGMIIRTHEGGRGVGDPPMFKFIC